MRQFHKMVINIFKAIQPGITLRSMPTGIYRNLYEDYLIFFNQLKEKSIVKFLKLNFQSHIVQGGTMALFDFFEILIKFFRIKCMTLVKTILQSRKNTMVKEKVKNIDPIQIEKKKVILSYKTPSNFYFKAKQTRTISDRSDKNDELQNQRQKFQLKCSAKTCTISEFEQRSRKLKTSRKLLKSAGYGRNNNQSPLRLSSRGEKRVIESYKGLTIRKQLNQSPYGLGQKYMEQQQKNSRKSLLLAQKRSISSNFQAYHNNFVQIFTDQWSNYKNLIGIQDLAILQQEDTRKQVNQTKKEIKKQQKKRWQKWLKQKFITSSYARNDTIRIQAQSYAESYKQ